MSNNKESKLIEMAKCIDRARLGIIEAHGKVSDFGMWYANVLYDEGYRKINNTTCELCSDESFTNNSAIVVNINGESINIVPEYCLKCGRKLRRDE